jgi:hypothetical protein
MFEPKIDYFGPLRMELFHATNKLLNAERSSSEYKYVPYEIARDEMKSFLTKNGLTVNLLVQPRYLFFMKELFPEDPAIVAYNAIYANMNAIKTTDPDLCKHPIILALLTEHKKILGYLTNEPLKAELTELTKGGKNIKKRYAKNTKGRRRQVSRKRKNLFHVKGKSATSGS